MKWLTVLTAALLVLSLARAEQQQQQQQQQQQEEECGLDGAVCTARGDFGHDGGAENAQAPIDSPNDIGRGTGWIHTEYTLSYFPVAGVNLALYGIARQEGDEDHSDNRDSSSDPFELFEDFHTGQVINAAEGNAQKWHQFHRYYKRNNKAPTLSFYNDKVAFKRWLLSEGIDLPRIMLLGYVSDFRDSDSSIEVDQLANTILQLLPANETDFVAKPSHKSQSVGVWVISRDLESGITRVGRDTDHSVGIATRLIETPDFDFPQLATNLAESILAEYRDGIGVAQKAPRHGIVVEERFTAPDRDDFPSNEFKCFVIWGRLYAATWRRGGWMPGFVTRDGIMVKGSEADKLLSSPAEKIPDWVDWSRVVGIAEQVGAHKDFFRVDIFVGIPAKPSSLREGTGVTVRSEDVRYAVNEVSPTSSELLPAPMIDEFTRLWVAGYKIGNFRVVPNTEVPSSFMTRAQEQEYREIASTTSGLFRQMLHVWNLIFKRMLNLR